MPIVDKRVRLLGREPIPRFAVRATLCWYGFASVNIPEEFPEQWTIYNIAALGLYPREGAIGSAIDPARSVTYWSNTAANGVDLTYGQDVIGIPHDCEWYSVAWLTPPSGYIDEAGPFPEDFFRIRWELAV
jgi:hypothetical protein